MLKNSECCYQHSDHIKNCTSSFINALTACDNTVIFLSHNTKIPALVHFTPTTVYPVCSDEVHYAEAWRVMASPPSSYFNLERSFKSSLVVDGYYVHGHCRQSLVRAQAMPMFCILSTWLLERNLG
jgi:hypothetical protein